MNTPFDGRQPKPGFQSMFDSVKKAAARKKGFVMIAPLWTDNDARQGKVFYHIYNLGADDSDPYTAATVFQRAQTDLSDISYTDVDVSWVIVITWVDMLPRMWYNPLVDQVR